MNFLESIKMAFTSLTINKLRSFLTMLGIIIGISAVITITTIGNSIQKTLAKTFNTLGASTLEIYVSPNDRENFYFDEIDDADKFTLADVQELIKQHPDELTYKINTVFGGASITSLEGESFRAAIYAVSDDYLDPYLDQIVKGRTISKADYNKAKHSCVVSDIFVQQYLGTKNLDEAIGKTVYFEMRSGENIKLTIVGVMEYTELEKREMGLNSRKLMDITTWLFMPYNTLLDYRGLSAADTVLNDAEIGWTDKCDSEKAKELINEYFLPKYKNNENVSFEIYDPKEELGIINTVLTVITVAISVIAAISLVVGGVGVMNIMLVSILERTREIGVRKALGALNSDIRSQFVIEAVIICLTGGLIGVAVGVFNGYLLSLVASQLLQTMASEYAHYISLSVSPSIPAIIISLSFSMLTGLIFGYYPAKRAGNMNPIDALRYE